MTVPQLTHAQSRRRIAELRRQGCDVAVITHESGDKTVMKRCPALLENPPPAPNLAGYLILAGFAAAALYAIFRPRKAAAAAPVVAPPIIECTLETAEDFARLESWATTKNLGVVYLPATTTPPSPAESELARSFVRTTAEIVVVTSDGFFWTYTSGEPVLSSTYRQDFCNFKPPATVSRIRWVN